MGKLNIGIEIRDFDLDRVGFSLSVLDDSQRRQSSEAYLRMSLPELDAFIAALRSAGEGIAVSTVEPAGLTKLPTVKLHRGRDPEPGPSFVAVG